MTGLIQFFYNRKLNLKYSHNQVIENLDNRKKNKIIDYFLNLDYQVMLIKNKDKIIILIDSGFFRQR